MRRGWYEHRQLCSPSCTQCGVREVYHYLEKGSGYVLVTGFIPDHSYHLTTNGGRWTCVREGAILDPISAPLMCSQELFHLAQLMVAVITFSIACSPCQVHQNPLTVTSIAPYTIQVSITDLPAHVLVLPSN